MKKLLLILLCLPMIGFGQSFTLKTYVPDDNFENYLESNGMGDGIQLNDSINFWAIEMLMILDVSNQNISDLTGIEDFTVLRELDCGSNQLSSLDLSQNIYLDNLECSFNQITYLDLSNNTELTKIYLDDNQLTYLDLRNGNNINIIDFYATYNPNLTCINVDNVAWSTSNWLVSYYQIDSQHYFSANCLPSAIEEYTTNKELLKVTDLLGRETKQTNQPLFYIYDDGKVEKRIIIE
jgi:Leucine-rich repeat (LRR) protein